MMTEIPSIEEIEAQGGSVGLRMKAREWWKSALTGKTRISLPDLAHEAERHFANDPKFLGRFWDTFGYDVLYDIGVNLLSERRIMNDGDGGLMEGIEEWFERNEGGHVSLAKATDEEWDAAIHRREEEIALAIARVQALREMRKGTAVAGIRGIAYNVRIRDEPIPIEVVVADPESGELRPIAEIDPLCHICHRVVTQSDMGSSWSWCPPCEAKYGHHLLKATVDPFDYAMRLTSGDLIFFEEARIKGEWVYLTDVRGKGELYSDFSPKATPNPPFERGLQVHISAIAWCADAPFGS